MKYRVKFQSKNKPENTGYFVRKLKVGFKACPLPHPEMAIVMNKKAFDVVMKFLEEQGDLLRRMVATGQSVGILVNASDRERSVTEQLEAGNAALERATCGRTRLTMIERGTSRDRRNAEKEGYRCLQATLNRAQYDLANTDNANTLLKRVAAKRGDVSVWLADTVRVAGLRALLNTVKQGGARCLGWTETA